MSGAVAHGAVDYGAVDYTVLPADVAGATVASVAQPAPSPSPAPNTFTPESVSPGLAGFIPVFLIALASVVLFLSLTRHLRRVTVRQAARDAQDRQDAAGGAPDGGPDAGGRRGDPRDGDGTERARP